MKAIKDTLKSSYSHQSFDDLKQKILKDTDVADFIAAHHLSPEEIHRSLSKFNQYITERDKYFSADESYVTKGYQPILAMNEGYADVAYHETKALKEAQKRQEIKKRVTLIGLPSTLKDIATTDIDLDDPNRIQLYSEINAYIKDFEAKKDRGLYIFGVFGIGKSYLMAYLANRLSDKYQKQTTLLHFPTFAIDIRHAINNGSVKESIDQIKTSEILILDDIGAEQHSSWIRDDVLQVILQYRMQENLLTFFTSNFDLNGLEKHFAKSKSGDETWQAKRVMERISYLAREIHLEGNNRRHNRD